MISKKLGQLTNLPKKIISCAIAAVISAFVAVEAPAKTPDEQVTFRLEIPRNLKTLPVENWAERTEGKSLKQKNIKEIQLATNAIFKKYIGLKKKKGWSEDRTQRYVNSVLSENPGDCLKKLDKTGRAMITWVTLANSDKDMRIATDKVLKGKSNSEIRRGGDLLILNVDNYDRAIIIASLMNDSPSKQGLQF